MELILVGEDLLTKFECLLPVEFKNAADIPGVVLIGAMEEEGLIAPKSSDDTTKESAEDVTNLPVGIMVLSFIHEDELRILWTFVDPDFRGYGIGEAMLEKAFEIALADGRKRVTARIWGEDDEKEGKFYGDSWLAFHRFTWSGDRYPEWFVSLNELYKAKGYGWVQDADESHVKPLKSVAAPVRNKLFSSLVDNADYSWFSDIPISSDLVDMDFSFAYMKDNKCIAALIIERIGNTYYPVAMVQDCDADTFRNFMGTAFHKLSEGGNGFLRLAPHDESALKITRLSLDGIEPYSYRIFIAPATAIQDMVREEEAKAERQRRSAELDDLLPESFVVTGIDYYSGVEV